MPNRASRNHFMRASRCWGPSTEVAGASAARAERQGQAQAVANRVVSKQRRVVGFNMRDSSGDFKGELGVMGRMLPL